MIADKKRYNVFFVDGDHGIRKLFSDDLKGLGCNVSSFASGTECLEQITKKKCNLLITDVRIPDMDGLALLSKVRCQAPWVSVIVISGYADIAMAVRAMHSGAVDFIEKSTDRKALINRVKIIMSRDDSIDSHSREPLTETEKKVLKLILDGLGNKQIAYKLKRSLRMAEMHRSKIMHKFDVDNIVDLVKKAIANHDNVK